MNNLRSMEILKVAKNRFTEGEYDKSLALLDQIIESEKEDKETLAESFFCMANIFHLRGELGKAIQGFQKVLELQPNHTDASISLSVLYNDIGHYEQGKQVFESANKRVKSYSGDGENFEDKHINKKFSMKHFELAEMYQTYNRYDEALFEFTKSIQLDPHNLEARVKIAKVYAKKNFISKAFDELKKLKNEEPNYLPGRVALGILYYGNGHILEAQMEWEKVLARDPRNEEALMYLNLSKTATETSL